MTVYKISDRMSKSPDGFSAIVFDCDGVLIDASKSYDLALWSCGNAFASILGVKLDEAGLARAVEALRELGTFNNDWDTLAVLVANLYGLASDTMLLDEISSLNTLSEKLKRFEAGTLNPRKTNGSSDFSEALRVVQNSKEGTKRDEIIAKLLPDEAVRNRLYNAISYPKPVGEGLLATVFDEIVYGKLVFKNTYGIECVTQKLSVPGLITHEKKLVKDETLSSLAKISGGRLGIITGRPRVPTIYTLGNSYRSFFPDPEICLFTGDYMLNTDEVKPSPKPMLKVANKLSKASPIIYVGDSGEDLMMAKNANSMLGGRVLFAAVATSKEKVEFFERHENYVDCIVSSVNELPQIVDKSA